MERPRGPVTARAWWTDRIRRSSAGVIPWTQDKYHLADKMDADFPRRLIEGLAILAKILRGFGYSALPPTTQWG